MMFFKGKRSHLKKMLPPGDFTKLGLRADYIGSDTIAVSRGGKQLGRIRQSVGTYIWYPVETDQAQFRAFTPGKALAYLARRL